MASEQVEVAYKKFVNEQQTPGERWLKYNYLRLCGMNACEARRWRDCTISHINAHLDMRRTELIGKRASQRTRTK